MCEYEHNDQKFEYALHEDPNTNYKICLQWHQFY
jgi:hypothetical protein